MPDRANRLELARRLHDGLAQDLAALGYRLDDLIAEQASSPELKSELRRIRFDIISVIDKFRDEIYLLRSINFEELAETLQALLEGQILNLDLPHGLLTTENEDALSRAILEIARNSVRHSGCTRFSIAFTASANNRLVIHVSDDGTGKIQTRIGSFGLSSIAEEISRAGAKCEQLTDETGNHYFIEIDLV